MKQLCAWCGKDISERHLSTKYCTASHRQMAWAKRNPSYRQRQREQDRERKNKGIRLATRIRFIHAAQILEKDKDILTA